MAMVVVWIVTDRQTDRQTGGRVKKSLLNITSYIIVGECHHTADRQDGKYTVADRRMDNALWYMTSRTISVGVVNCKIARCLC